MNERIKSLPFFPTPYPDECFYSILCRYHVRSGNLNGISTINSLFGRYRVVASTLHTAFRAEYLEQWVPASKEISPERIVYDHSSYQYALLCYIESAALFSSPWMKKALNEYLEIPYDRLYMNCLCVGKRHGAICYCPACAEEERRVYGEPYWHVLHQMDGVEFCPVHGEPILRTELDYGHRRTMFFPASETGRLFPAGVPSQSAIDSTEADREAFMRLARDIEWLLKNGLRLDRDVPITQALAQGKDHRSDSSQSENLSLSQLAKEALTETSPAFSQVITGKLESDRPAFPLLRCLSHAVVFAYLMGTLYGSAETFYRSAYHSSTVTAH
jgi:hypothetical protein